LATEHTVTLPNGEQLTYQMERRKRRTIGLKITHEGLMIHAPMRITMRYLEGLIVEKSNWIQKKLSAREAQQPLSFHWENGESLLYLGQPIILNVHQNARSKKVVLQDGQLMVALPKPDNEVFVAKKVVDWYAKAALADFEQRITLFAKKLGVPTPSLYLSNAKTRWGSCNSRKEIRLNWRLLQAPPHIINYVVCHELSHLKEMNHSAKFWAIVEGLCPAYKQAEKDLKALSQALHRM
jgi:predicted metal-dependent hydrolase